MQVVKHINELRSILNEQRNNGLSIGFVPTMGALHDGHLSLVSIASEQVNYIVVSIFVNPTQFNDKKDLERYPRDLQKDLLLLSKTTCNMVFAPESEEIYPEPDTRKFDFGTLETVMEGQFRPGHFNGVAQVVSRLFDIVSPDKAYFGQKDFQQLAIIREMVKQLESKVEIVACPIIREENGLAMSSRNMLLSDEQRNNASLIYRTIAAAANKIDTFNVNDLCEWVKSEIDKNDYLNTEYFEIVNELTLQPIGSWTDKCNKVACIAVHCGKIRLIDNIVFSSA